MTRVLLAMVPKSFKFLSSDMNARMNMIGNSFLYPCTGVPRLSELCLQTATVLQDGYLQSLVSRNVLPEALAAAVRDHRRKMRVYKPQAIVLPE